MLRIVYYDQNRIWAWVPLHAKEEKKMANGTWVMMRLLTV